MQFGVERVFYMVHDIAATALARKVAHVILGRIEVDCMLLSSNSLPSVLWHLKARFSCRWTDLEIRSLLIVSIISRLKCSL